MLNFMKITVHTLKVFLLFTGCTILFYYGMMWVNEEYQSYHRYDEPKGTALKVSSSSQAAGTSIFDRLVLFYLNGE
ncbi:YqzK family protein [Bacillus sp. EB600]|uniref:YqzK family protein n=1 Tax=Bacillus sp. EB600 TaxID=2806345 RepID=UPI00210E8B4C|nr:YqzK family protein [Bacillus sp. EB600]MCQ6277987.1 YqzK family protein [Bacillus sp. EB600]